jgi:signal transduction histidine kinase
VLVENGASIAIPLRVGGTTIGAVVYAFPESRAFSSDYLASAKTFGKEVGLALDRARTRAALEAARAAAETASDAKSSFLATMSHELRTPINAILGFTDLLQMGVVGAPSALQAGYLQRIRRSTEHLLELINDVLDLSKIEAGRLSVTPELSRADAVITESVSLLRQAALDGGLTLDVDCGPEMMYLGDPLRVRQVLLNLLSNAIKFTPAGGSVRMECAPHDDIPGTIAFIVTDTGIGIAPDQLDRIFEPFTQGERGYTRTHGGSGLGLAISRQLARMMDGDVAVTSDMGQGSRFVLTLPTRQR